jgi:cold shock CspA family protein
MLGSAEIQKELGNQSERLSKLRQAVASDAASIVGRYVLATAYRDKGEPKLTMDVLDPVIKNDFTQVRSYLVYVRAMLHQVESPKKCAATLAQCKLDGGTNPAFVGLYGGLLYIDGSFEAAKKVWDDATEQNFTTEERNRRQYIPLDVNGTRMRFRGTVMRVKPSFIFISPTDGFDVISFALAVDGVSLKKGDSVEFSLSFSARSSLAENVRLV